ncbi:hypothetical protein [Wolbachia endosymbiont of Litomosoides sigmodontis]|nr:hypothetical protein [Wolbachia endosymbiont of Litomosoides sigmodontis]
MRIRVQEKFDLNVNKSIVCCDMQKMKLSYIAPRLIHNEQGNGKQ